MVACRTSEGLFGSTEQLVVVWQKSNDCRVPIMVFVVEGRWPIEGVLRGRRGFPRSFLLDWL